MDRRAELKRAYKQNPPAGGVFQIKNLKNGKIFIGKGPNVEAKIRSNQFTLKMNVHKNAALQNDWNVQTPEDFEFTVLDYLKPKDEPGFDFHEELTVLEQLWLEKLQPYGEKGYNKL